MQPCRGLTWTIDAWGNRTDQNVTAGTCNTFHQTVDAQNRLVGPPYQYDAAGNMTNDGSHAYTYDAENRLVQVDAGATATYVYDANGLRVRKTVGASNTDFLYDLARNVIAEGSPGCGSLCWTVFHLYANGSLLAEYKDNTTYFVHKDLLGSTRLITKMDQTVLDSMDYLPFGEQIAGGSGTTHKFTGLERDPETGLDHALFRQYSSSMGRWTTPDPAGQAACSLQDPESLNRYAYVKNDPLNSVDPSGLFGEGSGCSPFNPFCHPIFFPSFPAAAPVTPVSARPSR
jgi:RHS repeat-associated protein